MSVPLASDYIVMWMSKAQQLQSCIIYKKTSKIELKFSKNSYCMKGEVELK
jgi:hypothetical protein